MRCLRRLPGSRNLPCVLAATANLRSFALRKLAVLCCALPCPAALCLAVLGLALSCAALP